MSRYSNNIGLVSNTMSDNAIDFHDDRFMTSLETDYYYTVSMQIQY